MTLNKLINVKRLALIGGPLIFIACCLVPAPDGGHPKLLLMGGFTAWMALWWLTEAVPLAVTSFLPFLILPSSGIIDIREAAAQYMDPILFLFIGGFLIAFAIERWGLHRRLALHILSATGGSVSSILLGVMVTAFILSMWISNTATVMMMLSAVLAVIQHLKAPLENEETHRKVASALMTGLAYSATIGGMATLVGTPTNMIFLKSYSEHYSQSHPVTFLSWMALALPLAIVLLIITWKVIRMVTLRKYAALPFEKQLFRKELGLIGKWNADEKIVFLVFLTAAILWFTRSGIETESFRFTGWASLLPYPDQIHDSTVAIGAALLLFLIPSRTEKGRTLLTWNEASRIPYEIILLFGSGFALAKGFDTSGLSNYISGQLHFLKEVNVVLVILGICLTVTFISEFASNVASIQLVMPILISLQSALDIDPRLLLLPAALAASNGFMLPVATAPNTIAFSTGHIRVSEMAATGFFTNLAAILLITVACLLLA